MADGQISTHTSLSPVGNEVEPGKWHVVIAWVVGAVLGAAVGLMIASILGDAPSAATYDNVAKTIELFLISVGLLSIVYFSKQYALEHRRDRQAADAERTRAESERLEREKHRRWGRIDAYYRYFRSLPNLECHDKFCRAAIEQLKFDVPQLDGKGANLNKTQMDAIKNDPTLDRICRDYLDEFEMFAAGVRANFIDGETAYSIEGGRLCRIVTNFKPLIDRAQEQNPKAYCELEELFTVWSTRRAQELRPKALATNHADHT